MKTDVTYCCHANCIHRRACKKWLGNYNIPKSLLLSVFEGVECADAENAEDRYKMLIRFRKSDGSEL